MRKIIQISTCMNESVSIIYALCDDGKIFENYAGFQNWTELPPIPQDKIEVENDN